jgi:hypothetical protein
MDEQLQSPHKSPSRKYELEKLETMFKGVSMQHQQVMAKIEARSPHRAISKQVPPTVPSMRSPVRRTAVDLMPHVNKALQVIDSDKSLASEVHREGTPAHGHALERLRQRALLRREAQIVTAVTQSQNDRTNKETASKPFLKRKSQAVTSCKLPDWTKVQSKTETRLDRNLILKAPGSRTSTPANSCTATPRLDSAAALNTARSTNQNSPQRSPQKRGEESKHSQGPLDELLAQVDSLLSQVSQVVK